MLSYRRDKEPQLESLADFMWVAIYSGNKWQTPVCSSLATIKKQPLINCNMGFLLDCKRFYALTSTFSVR